MASTCAKTTTNGEGKKKDFPRKNVCEYGIDISIDVGAVSPKRSECFYDENVKLTRSLITTALAVYAESELSVFKPVNCLEGIASTGVSGLLWSKHLLEKVIVTINGPSEKACARIKENSQLNELSDKIIVSMEDPCILLQKEAYNFVYLDCFATSSLYFDSAMKRMPRGGLLAFSTMDDPALYGKIPEVAIRCYGGNVVRTFYYKELAIRLLLAALARSAGRHNKAIRVLFCVAFKGSFSLVVQLNSGPVRANTCLQKLRRLIHCNMCEDRAFYPDSLYPIEDPYSLLSCDCKSKFPGKTASELGPLWSAEIFDHEFVSKMQEIRVKFPWSSDVAHLLDQILDESLCLSREEVLSNEEGKSEASDSPKAKKARLDEVFSEKASAPAFYFNLHKHSPKGAKMLRVDRVVVCLRNSGFRASRTHFDLEAVRTNAPIQKLIHIMATGIPP